MSSLIFLQLTSSWNSFNRALQSEHTYS